MHSRKLKLHTFLMSCGDHRIQERIPEPRAFCFGYLCLPAVYIYIIRIGEWYTYFRHTVAEEAGEDRVRG